MNKLFLISLLFLTGCSTTRITEVKREFPEAPLELMHACPDLKKLTPDENKLKYVLQTVVTNYSYYHECSSKNAAWQEWYLSNKKIWDEK